MLTANVFALLEGASFTKSKAQSAAFTTESSSPGPRVPSSGEGSNHPGDALVAGLSLILLLVAALAIQLGVLTQQEADGNRSSPSINTSFPPKRRSGGTAKAESKQEKP